MEKLKEIFSRLHKSWTWSAQKRCDFYKLCASFIADGKPVFETLEVIEKRWVEKKDPRGAYLTEMLAGIRGKSGRSLRLGEAIAQIAPPIEAMAVDAGDHSGDIANGFVMAKKIAEDQAKVRSVIRGELFYPAFLVLMLVGLLYMLRTAIMPVFGEIAPRYSWPASAQALGWLADNVELVLGLFFGFVGFIVVVFNITKSRWVGDVRQFFDFFVPPWNIYRKVSSATILSCFSQFINAGVPFSAIINNMLKTASEWESYHLENMRAKMRRGIPDADALAGELFDEDTRWEISVYGSTTNFAQALQSISNRLTETTLSSIKKAAGVFRTLIMFGVAGMVIWIYGTFFAIVMAAKNVGGM